MMLFTYRPRALELFNREGLMEVDVLYNPHSTSHCHWALPVGLAFWLVLYRLDGRRI